MCYRRMPSPRYEWAGMQDETADWPERNGMNGITHAWVAEAGADNERNVTKGGGTKCSPGV